MPVTTYKQQTHYKACGLIFHTFIHSKTPQHFFGKKLLCTMLSRSLTPKFHQAHLHRVPAMTQALELYAAVPDNVRNPDTILSQKNPTKTTKSEQINKTGRQNGIKGLGNHKFLFLWQINTSLKTIFGCTFMSSQPFCCRFFFIILPHWCIFGKSQEL